MAAWLMVYVDALDAAQTSAEAVAAVRSCAPLVAGGVEALLCDLPDPHMPDGSVVMTPAEAGWPSDGSRNGFSMLFERTRAAQFLCTRLTDRLLLVLVERRRARVFTAEDRDLVMWIVTRARRALLRLDPEV
jgi:hypothetical protein